MMRTMTIKIQFCWTGDLAVCQHLVTTPSPLQVWNIYITSIYLHRPIRSASAGYTKQGLLFNHENAGLTAIQCTAFAISGNLSESSLGQCPSDNPSPRPNTFSLDKRNSHHLPKTSQSTSLLDK